MLSRLLDTLWTVAGGCALGVVLCLAVEDNPTPPLLLASAALGAVVVNAFRQATSRRGL
jgi:hypothetical protein